MNTYQAQIGYNKGVIRLIQSYIIELDKELEYLKNASIELQALLEELEGSDENATN